ncbi:MAG: putative metalloprotease CJM1_0395 family protein [bacterium]
MEVSTSLSPGVQAHYASVSAKQTFSIGAQELSPEEEKILKELRQLDMEVRRHEQAHKATAGPYATGGPVYKYVTGPDGKQYAVGGEIKIDTSEVPDNPQATIRKAQAVRRAALAPRDPSSEDRRVAAKARQMEVEARRELAKQKREKLSHSLEDGEQDGGPPSAVDVFA